MYQAQKNNPSPGDWCELVGQDFKEMGIHMSDDHIAGMPSEDYKKYIKETVHEKAFQDLQKIKNSHSKVKENVYSNMKHPQTYFTNKNISFRQSSIIFALRSRTLRGIKNNFKKMNLHNTLCPLCERLEDTQQHVLYCKVLQDCLPHTISPQYEHVNGDPNQQAAFIKVYEKYLIRRDQLLEEAGEDTSLPGLYTGPMRPRSAPSQGDARRCDSATSRGHHPSIVV